MKKGSQPTRGILRVGGGRGFAVMRRNHLGNEERIIITAGHCLPHLPPCHPARYLKEETYQELLAPLGSEPMVWATCLFVDPVSDIAALGQPDNQALSDEADAYDQLLDGMETLAIADAPAQGSEKLTFGNSQVEKPTPRDRRAYFRSTAIGSRATSRAEAAGLTSSRATCSRVACRARRSYLDDKAIGVVSVDHLNPVLMDTLSPWLLRSIIPAAKLPRRRR